MNPIRAVCFDLDGTLYDLKKQQRKLWKTILRHPIVLHHWQKETAAMRGRRSPSIHQDIADAVAKKTGRSPESAAAIIHQAIFVDYPATFHPGDATPRHGLYVCVAHTKLCMIHTSQPYFKCCMNKLSLT